MEIYECKKTQLKLIYQLQVRIQVQVQLERRKAQAALSEQHSAKHMVAAWRQYKYQLL